MEILTDLRYNCCLFRVAIRILILSGMGWFSNSLNMAQEIVDLTPFEVEASHDLGGQGHLDLLALNWVNQIIQEAQPLALDEVLHLDPTFSFYRRQSSAFANPSTQGVSLRNIGASAAGRSLVVLDGIPQNDPFGGWVSWARFLSLGLESVSIQPSSKATSWGQMSAGGVIRIRETAISENRLENRTLGGQASTYSSEWLIHQKSGAHGIAVEGRHLESNGRYLIHQDDRGSIDRTAQNQHDVLNMRWEHEGEGGMKTQFRYAYFNESRNNGTEEALNSTLANDASLRISQPTLNGGWSLSLYHQKREFENTFTSVSADRISENPVNHQFSIPGEAFGFKMTGFREIRPGWSVLAGLDGHRVSGQTNEDTGWGLVNRRKAGGRQALIGGFISNQLNWANNQSFDLNFRLDRWEIMDGARIESNKSSGIVTNEQTYTDRSGWEPGASVSYQRVLSKSLIMGLGGSSSFRLPSINELYRPFRVRNDITEANASLIPERFYSVEGNLKWTPVRTFSVAVGLFEYWIQDIIANGYEFDGPGQSIGGFVPAGGTFSRKQNVKDSRVSGAQLKIEYDASDCLRFGVNYYYSDARFLQNPGAPGIEYHSFPQIPLHKWVLFSSWNPYRKLRIDAQWTTASEQYDDALNTRELDGYSRLDLMVSYDVTPTLSLYMKANNVTDEVILTGKSSSGIRSIAPSRTIWVGLHWRLK